MREIESLPQELEGGCGPVALQMALRAIGVYVSQKALAHLAEYDPKWGTTHKGMEEAAKYFSNPTTTTNASLENLSDIARHFPVIVNFMDTDGSGDPFEEGHYALLRGLQGACVAIVDGDGVRLIDRRSFEHWWWDIVDEKGTIVKRWAMILAPKK